MWESLEKAFQWLETAKLDVSIHLFLWGFLSSLTRPRCFVSLFFFSVQLFHLSTFQLGTAGIQCQREDPWHHSEFLSGPLMGWADRRDIHENLVNQRDQVGISN